jgi:hypothetical protein
MVERLVAADARTTRRAPLPVDGVPDRGGRASTLVAGGVDGATMDVRADCVVVRCPMVAGDLEFTPGSY